MKLSRTSIGLAARAARDAAGLTLSDLSAVTGITISSLSRSEAGLRDMTFAEVVDIASAVGIDEATFLVLAESFEPNAESNALVKDLKHLQRVAVETAIAAQARLSSAPSPN